MISGGTNHLGVQVEQRVGAFLYFPLHLDKCLCLPLSTAAGSVSPLDSDGLLEFLFFVFG